MRHRFKVLAALCLFTASLPVLAEEPPQHQTASPPATDAGFTTVPIGYLKQEVKRPLPLSRLNIEPEDLGVAGAEIALKDNNTTGRFTKQQFILEVEKVPIGGDAVAALKSSPIAGTISFWSMRQQTRCCVSRTRSKARKCCCST